MEFTFTHFVIVILIILSTYLWNTSHRFRYYAIVWTYHGVALVTSALCLPFVALRPGNPSNLWPIQQWWNFAFKIAGIEVEKKNCAQLENLKEPAILIVNHQSSFDFIGIMQVSPFRATYLSKKEILFLGPFGIGAWLCGVVLIDRLNPDSARETMKKTAQKLKDDNIKLWIFPEGTRNYKGGLLPFKKGAFHLAVQAQVPIYPVVLSSYKSFWDPKKKILNKGKVIVSSLPPLQTTGLSSDDVSELTEKVRSQMIDEYEKNSSQVATEIKARGNSLLAE